MMMRRSIIVVVQFNNTYLLIPHKAVQLRQEHGQTRNLKQQEQTIKGRYEHPGGKKKGKC